MGKDFYEQFPQAKAVFAEVDEALGKDLSNIIFTGAQEELNLTENTQPAIMATSIAIWRVIAAETGLDIGDFCSYAAGHSLGEYSALCASGALSLADTAMLLKIRGEAMQKAVPVGVGAMAAILGLDFGAVADLAKEADCEAANDNAEGQVVISGSKGTVAKAIELAKARGAKRAVELPVSAPFHCRLMQPAAEKMQEALATVKILAPKVPLIANVTAEKTSDPELIRKLLVSQVTGMVRWRESVRYLKNHGIENLVEIGFGKVLTGLTKRIEESLNSTCIQNVEDFNAFKS